MTVTILDTIKSIFRKFLDLTIGFIAFVLALLVWIRHYKRKADKE